MGELDKVKRTCKRKIVIGVVLLFYAVTWFPGHPAVHDSIDFAEGRDGHLRTRSIPILPCILLCSSNSTAELGGRHAIGSYMWNGFGVLRTWEVPTVIA